MLGPNDLPFSVSGNRTLILEKPAKEKTTGGLHIPDSCKERYFSGRLLDAGLQARDTLYDHGYEIGDEVEFGKYAGLKEAWDRVVEGPCDLPDDSYNWKFERADGDINRVYKCANTGATREIGTIIILNVDDLVASVELAARIRTGIVSIKRGVTPDGKTQHYFERSAA